MLRTTLKITSAALILAACSGDGRTMRPAGPDQTQSIGVSTTATAVTGFSMTTPWEIGAAIDKRHTCEGGAISPRIEFSNIPVDIVTIGLVMIDETSDAKVLWVVANVDPATPVLEEGTLPAGAITGLLPSGTLGYEAPCPTPGTSHSYRLIGYALPQQVELQTGTPAQTIVDTLEAAALDVTSSNFVSP